MAPVAKILSPISMLGNLLKGPQVPAALAPPSQKALDQAPGIVRRNLQQNRVDTIFGGSPSGQRNFLGGN